MFKSSYASMLEKANENFKKKEIVLEMADQKFLKQLLQSAVSAAIKSYNQGSISDDRRNDIEVIGLIFIHCTTVEECRKKLELYFSGKPAKSLFENEKLSRVSQKIINELSDHQFKTGFMDGSKLEDYVVATVDSFYEHIIQPLLFEEKERESINNMKHALHQCLKNAKYEALNKELGQREIGRAYTALESKIDTMRSLNQFYIDLEKTKNCLVPFLKKNMKPILDKNIRFHENYDEQVIHYKFQDFLKLHLEIYQQEKGSKKGRYDLDQHVINQLSNADNLDCIRRTMKMSPLLKKHLVNAENEFKKNALVRRVKTKTWMNPETASNPPKIIIAVHGWRDSVECWNKLGQAAIQKGYKVIAYDQRGYGFDSARKDMGQNNDCLSIDFRKFLQSVIEENPEAEINLVGHSMGGAVLLNNQDFIATQKINSVTCFSPAVTPSIPSFASEIRNALLGRNSHEEVLARQHNNQPRYVAAGLSQPANILKIITTLPHLLSMMSQAFQSLKSLVSKEPKLDSAPWTIFYGKRDKAVPFSSFEEVRKNKPNEKVSFEAFPRGDHLLTQGRHSSAVLDKFFAAIESKTVGTEDVKTNRIKM